MQDFDLIDCTQLSGPNASFGSPIKKSKPHSYFINRVQTTSALCVKMHEYQVSSRYNTGSKLHP
jgi:hypothetical protein